MTGADALAEAERWWREYIDGADFRKGTHLDLLLAEYDRMKAALVELSGAAETDRSGHDPRCLLLTWPPKPVCDCRIWKVVDEPLPEEVSPRPGPAVTDEQVSRVVEQLREEAQLPGPGAHVRGLREAFHDAADLVERELGVSVPASPADDGSGT